MSIGDDQKKIIKICNHLFNKSSQNIKGLSPLTYFGLWGKTLGFERIKLKIYGLGYLPTYFLEIFKDILSISKLSSFKILKKNKLDNINYRNLVVSNAGYSDFATNGTYTDRYFKINSKTSQKNIFFLIYLDKLLPKKIDKNVVLLINNQTKFKYNIFFLIKYILCKLIKSKLSLRYFFNITSTYNRLAEISVNCLKKEINLEKIKKIIIPYEGQVFQNKILREAKKINKNILTIGYEHSAPHSVPVHLIHSSSSPDMLFINGESQLNHFSKFLNWPKKKLVVVPSARYPKNLDLEFENKVFLPYEIFDKQIIIDEFKNLIINSPIHTFNFFKIKNHPMAFNSKKHNLIKLELEKIQNKYKNRFNKKKKKNSAIFIGPTTGVIVALEKKIKVIHICFNSSFDSYTNSLWPNLKAIPLSKNTFIYRLKKIGTFVKFSKYKNCYSKYYDI
ncbi:hypothetical protein OAM08_00530 [Pelagibacteraceae bacterium]|nr:hypothetical protein [Pelagibacteraceae bacterium]